MAENEQAAGAGDGRQTGAAQVERLANALRFEQAKNKVLLDEVVTLEDELVNRVMGDFDAFVTDETRDFWRDQLLTNREPALAALKEMQRCRVSGVEGTPSTGSRLREDATAGTAGQARRPLHNRATARPMIRSAAGGAATGGDTDDRAAKIRNRAQEISRAERVPFSAAFRRAEKELGGPASSR